MGNVEYAEENDTYGLTTLRDEHVAVGRGRVLFEFVGKHGLRHEVRVDDPRLVRIVRRCHELGGKVLFTYAGPDGAPVAVTSGDVNDYLRDLTGLAGTSAKDFRTWGGTVTVAEALAAAPPDGDTHIDQRIIEAIDAAADRLGNTRAVCRTAYVHPAIPEAYRSGELAEVWKRTRRGTCYSRVERTVLRILRDS